MSSMLPVVIMNDHLWQEGLKKVWNAVLYSSYFAEQIKFMLTAFGSTYIVNHVVQTDWILHIKSDISIFSTRYCSRMPTSVF